MQPLIEHTIGGKKENLQSKIFRILTFVLAITSLIISITGLSLANKNYLEANLFSYKFPKWADFVRLNAGTVVSLDTEGNAMAGAGTTITRNSYVDPNRYLTHVKICPINNWLYVAAGDNVVKFYEVDPRDLTIEADSFDTGLTVRDFVCMSNETFVILSPEKVFAFHVSFTWSHETGIAIQHTVDPTGGSSLPEGAQYPKIDTLDENTFCISYEGTDNKLYAMTGAVTYSGTIPRTALYTPQSFSDKYGFHGIAGLSTNNFVVIATGPRFNSSGFESQGLRASLVTIQSSQLSFSEWVSLPFSLSFNFFDMDNFDDRRVFVAYVNALNNNGIECVLLNYDRDTNTISWGSSLTYQHGGAVLDYERISLSILTSSRLALTYTNDAAHGSLVLGMIELTSTGSLVRASSEFVIDRPSRHSSTNRFAFDTCHGAPWRFVIIESHQNDTNQLTSLHVGSYMPRPVGIVTQDLFGSSSIQFAGTVSVSQTLSPGFMYYSNENGELKRGRPAGFAHREFGAFYVVDDDNNILSLHNQIGIATSDHELIIKTY